MNTNPESAEKIIEQAGRWKARARAAEAKVDKLTEAVERGQRDNARLQKRLDERIEQAAGAVRRAMNRADDAHERYERTTESERVAKRQAAEAFDARAAAERKVQEVQAEALETIMKISKSIPEPITDTDVVDPGPETREAAERDLRIARHEAFFGDGGIGEIAAEVVAKHLAEAGFPPAREEDAATISRQLDTIRDQAERIEELQDALQRHVDSSHEVRTQDFTNMREALGAGPGSDPILAARALRATHEELQRTANLQAESLDALQAERDELLQALKNRNGEGDPAEPGAHGWTIPRYGMLDLWMALHGSESSSTKFEEFYDRAGYADSWSELLDAVRFDARIRRAFSQYEGLAQIGANLARGALSISGRYFHEQKRELQTLAKLYEQEHAKLKR